MTKFIKLLNQISGKDLGIAGGKGANLGEMLKIGIPVPPGFVISALIFERLLEKTGVNLKVEAAWNRINIKDIKSIEENSKILRDLILKIEIPKDIEKSIFDAFSELNTKYVAVRSSATAEDSKINSWAGELETYLNTTRGNLIKNIKKCWASLYSPRVIFYRLRKNLLGKKIQLAVVVQKMIQSEVAGVCLTVHPITKDKNQMVIEAIFGLGEKLVQGLVTPDSYIVDKKELRILDINVNKQNKQKLSGKEIINLAKLCLKIENHYKYPQDIEWAIEKNKFYITQSRPITTL